MELGKSDAQIRALGWWKSTAFLKYIPPHYTIFKHDIKWYKANFKCIHKTIWRWWLLLLVILGKKYVLKLVNTKIACEIMLEITRREPICGGMYFKKAFDFHQPRALIWAYLRSKSPRPLFISPDGSPVNRPQFTQILNQSLNLDGLPSSYYKSHSFREYSNMT
jgi:hypothetical protein